MKRMLRWVGLGVVVLILVVVGIAVFGAMKPRDHVASRTINLPRPPAEVFGILEDVGAYPCWRTGVTRVEVLEQEPLRFVEHSEGGSMRFVIDEREPPTRLVSRIDDEGLPFGGTWTYELSPTESGTQLTITERGFVDNAIVRGMAALMMDPLGTCQKFCG